MEPEQQKAFREAVDRKAEAAEEASRHPEQNPRMGDPVTLDASGQMQPGIQTDDRGNQDVFSPRDKNSGHGKKTADKWNQ
ncbi:MAG: hypothetical protein M3P50_11985 [Actinomycetota bacterium]|nr:hypothetical protein [Actinomycetota bacterium]